MTYDKSTMFLSELLALLTTERERERERGRERERARGTGTSVTFSGTLVTIKGHFSNMQGTLVTCRHFGNSVRAL